ncbi:MAG: 50S ribosomal protein L25 [Verrucomicrobiota bacterium]
MAETIALKAEPRNKIGRNSVKKVRKEGKVPAVLYGKTETQALQIDTLDVIHALNGTTNENCFVDLEVGGKKSLALLQEVQVDPIKDRVIHMDLQQIEQDQVITVDVALLPSGESEGVIKGGGLLEQLIRTVKVKGQAKNIPHHVDADITSLQLGEAHKIGQINAPEGIDILTKPELIAFKIHVPRSARSAASQAAKAGND